jgi:hypothetical protein
MIEEKDLIPMLGRLFDVVGKRYSFAVIPKKDCIEYLFSHDNKQIKGRGRVEKTITNIELCNHILTDIKREEKRIAEIY